MHIKAKFKLSVLAAALAMSAGSAHAAIINTQTDVNNTGGSEVVLSIYDASKGISYALDTGIAFNSAYAITNGYSISLATDANFLSAFTGGLNSSMIWSLNAGDSTYGGSSAVQSGHRLWSTVNSVNPAMTNGEVVQGTGSLNTYISALNLVGTHPTVTNGSSFVTGSADPASFNALAGNYGNVISTFNTAGAVGSSLYAALISQACTYSTFGATCKAATPAVTTMTGIGTNLGQWTLSQAGTLSYSVSAVPVPAAVWLFGSGLVGLVGVARRRQTGA